jgi:rhodanese-related sulfurtransferase
MDYDVFGGAATGGGSGEGDRTDGARAGGEEADEITPRALAASLASGATPTLLDVREPYEWSIARLPEARLVPLDTLPDVVHTLDPSAEMIVYCHHGMRSAAAVAWLRERGFARARNLTGGIDRWSREVDPSTHRY